MPYTTDLTIYLKLDPHSAAMTAYTDSACTTQILETTVLGISSNPDVAPQDQPDPTIGVVFVNPDDPTNVKCGTVQFQIAPADQCPFGNSTLQADASKMVLIHDDMADLTAPNPSANKASIRRGLSTDTSYKFSIYASWNCSCGPKTYLLDPIIKIQN